MTTNRHRSLEHYIKDLHTEGLMSFTASDAKSALGISHSAFLATAERQQRHSKLLKPRQGFYVSIPPFWENFGGPSPFYYIDALMKHENEPYYVALLKAAAIHGASHQAVMEFQVMTEKRMPLIRAGCNRIKFYSCKSIESVAHGIEERRHSSGSVKVSSPALIALDLVRYPLAAAGLDNIATVLYDLGAKIKSKQLASLSNSFARPVIQCLGFFLDNLGFSSKTSQMYNALQSRGSIPWTEFNQRESRTGRLVTEPLLRDKKWKVIVRRLPEVD